MHNKKCKVTDVSKAFWEVMGGRGRSGKVNFINIAILDMQIIF